MLVPLPWPSGKVSDSKAADLSLVPAFPVRLFPGHTSDLTIGTSVATLPGAWHYRVSAGTGWLGVSILWLGEIASLIHNLYLSVAAHTIVSQIPPWDTLSWCWYVKQPITANTSGTGIILLCTCPMIKHLSNDQKSSSHLSPPFPVYSTPEWHDLMTQHSSQLDVAV